MKYNKFGEKSLNGCSYSSSDKVRVQRMRKRYLLIIPVAILIPIIVVSLPWAILGIGLFLLPNPPAPEIQYGEFPFKLEYELNGEQLTVEDTLICEFKGYESWFPDGSFGGLVICNLF